jgi:hypothetical protein
LPLHEEKTQAEIVSPIETAAALTDYNRRKYTSNSLSGSFLYHVFAP